MTDDTSKQLLEKYKTTAHALTVFNNRKEWTNMQRSEVSSAIENYLGRDEIAYQQSVSFNRMPVFLKIDPDYQAISGEFQNAMQKPEAQAGLFIMKTLAARDIIANEMLPDDEKLAREITLFAYATSTDLTNAKPKDLAKRKADIETIINVNKSYINYSKELTSDKGKLKKTLLMTYPEKMTPHEIYLFTQPFEMPKP